MSIDPAILRALQAAGATTDMIIAAVEAAHDLELERTARQIPWEQLRTMAFERDGEVCGYCGSTDGPFEIDHIIPRASGGENILSNVRVACRSCNRSKKDRDEGDWISARRLKDRERKRAARARERSADVRGRNGQGAESPPPPSPQSPPLKVSPDPFKESPPLTPQPVVVGRRAKPKFAPPEGVGLEQWEAFCQQRKKKLTDHAYSLVCGKLHTLAEAGWPPGKMIDLAIERGWETVFPPKDRSNDHRPANDRSEPQNPMVRAVIAAERHRRAGEQPF